jgi:hypothetical protein
VLELQIRVVVAVAVVILLALLKLERQEVQVLSFCVIPDQLNISQADMFITLVDMLYICLQHLAH